MVVFFELFEHWLHNLEQLVCSDDAFHVEEKHLQDVLVLLLVVNHFAQLLEKLKLVFSQILHLLLVLSIYHCFELRICRVEVKPRRKRAAIGRRLDSRLRFHLARRHSLWLGLLFLWNLWCFSILLVEENIENIGQILIFLHALQDFFHDIVVWCSLCVTLIAIFCENFCQLLMDFGLMLPCYTEYAQCLILLRNQVIEFIEQLWIVCYNKVEFVKDASDV